MFSSFIKIISCMMIDVLKVHLCVFSHSVDQSEEQAWL